MTSCLKGGPIAFWDSVNNTALPASHRKRKKKIKKERGRAGARGKGTEEDKEKV